MSVPELELFDSNIKQKISVDITMYDPPNEKKLEEVEKDIMEKIIDPLEDDFLEEKHINALYMKRENMIFKFLILNSKFRLDLNEQNVFKFKVDFANDVYLKLVEEMAQRKEWYKYPGYKLMLYAYRALPMPIIFSDSMITLPKVSFLILNIF